MAEDLPTPPRIPFEGGGGPYTLTAPGAPPVPGGIIGLPVMGAGTRPPQQRGQYQAKIDLTVVSSRIVVPLYSGDSVVAQVESLTIGAAGSTYPAAVVLTHKVSADGYRFTAVTGAATMTTEGISAQIPVSGWPFYALEVTTAAGAACLALITVQVKSNT